MSAIDPILTAKEVAKELRCSKTHVYALMHGKVGKVPMPHLLLGRKMVVRRSAFEIWKQRVEEHMLPPDSKQETVGAIH